MRKFSKTYLGIIGGIIVGVLNVLPMILHNISLDADISTFLTWVIIGFLISRINLKFQGFLKGIIISILVFIPSTIFVIESNLSGAIWIIATTLIYGSLLGYLIDRFGEK